MSNVKLGLLVLWPAFWTGFPLKLAFGLLLLAGHLHPWEGTGLGLMLLVSVPIDIWALGLCGRTVFLDRLQVDPPKGLGLTLWWQWTLFNVVYLPILYVVVGGVTSGAKAGAASLIEFTKEHVWPTLPIAEQIAIELVLWGSVAGIVLLLMLLGWLFGLGAIVQRQVRVSQKQEGTLQDMVYRWDRLRIPADQGLLLTAFTGTGVVLVFLFWGLLPATTPHPHEEYEYTEVVKVEPPVKPLEVLKKTETVLKKAEVAVAKLEEEKGKDSKDSEVKKAGKDSTKTKQPSSGPKAKGS